MTERLWRGTLGRTATPLVVGWMVGTVVLSCLRGSIAAPPNLLPLPKAVAGLATELDAEAGLPTEPESPQGGAPLADPGWLPPVESSDVSQSRGAVPMTLEAGRTQGHEDATMQPSQVRPLPAVDEAAGAYRRGRTDSRSVPQEPLADPSRAPSLPTPALPAPSPAPSLSAGAAPRPKQLEETAREADALTRHGFELAGRGAYFSARAEFTDALRLLAQALDEEGCTRAHEAALAAGWTALSEANDFLAGGSRLEADLDVVAIVAGHRTPVLKSVVAQDGVRQAGMPVLLTPRAAVQAYLTYAQQQLAEAAGGELAGSMALHGLGKLHDVLAARDSATIRAARPKAVVFYQAALLVCPRNYMAANDLGVLLDRGGRYEDARRMLEHSVSVRPQPVGWRNLAVVYRQLGQADLAQKAHRQWAAAVQAARGPYAARPGQQPYPAPAVQWVDPSVFAQGPGEPSPVPLRTPAGRSPTASLWPPRQARPLREIGLLTPSESSGIVLCQALGPAAPCPICAVDCSTGHCDWSRRGGWEGARAIAWQAYAQGEYVGHARTAHVPAYRIRVDDQLDMIFRLTREETIRPYKLTVGDEIRVESFTDAALTRDLILQPDGTITLRLLGQVHATGKTVPQLTDELEKAYVKFYKVPAITVTPLRVNTKLEDLRATVDRRAGIGGQSQLVKVTPEGTISLPAIGTVPAQGLTIPELQKELKERYREEIEGMEIVPVLAQRASRFVYVLGEVRTPGRYELTGPTTVIQAISMAGSFNVGSNLRQVVVFRRGDDWRLLATMVNLHAALYGNQPCPQGEIWLSDSDVVLVPKAPILVADEFINLVFTKGIYGVFPFSSSWTFTSLATL